MLSLFLNSNLSKSALMGDKALWSRQTPQNSMTSPSWESK